MVFAEHLLRPPTIGAAPSNMFYRGAMPPPTQPPQLLPSAPMAR